MTRSTTSLPDPDPDRVMTPGNTTHHDRGSVFPSPGNSAAEYSRSRVLELLAEGLTQVEVAQRVGISQATVSRIAASQQELVERGPMEQAVDAIAAGLDDVSPELVARVEVARALACRLDLCRRSRSTAASMSAASIARELQRALDEISAGRPVKPDRIDELIARRALRLSALRAGGAPEAYRGLSQTPFSSHGGES